MLKKVISFVLVSNKSSTYSPWMERVLARLGWAGGTNRPPVSSRLWPRWETSLIILMLYFLGRNDSMVRLTGFEPVALSSGG